MRSLCDAFAAGFNYYLARHPEVRPRLITKIEPWYTLAFIRYNYYQNGFARDNRLWSYRVSTQKLRPSSAKRRIERLGHWSEQECHGHAMLFINPHLPFFGSGPGL